MPDWNVSTWWWLTGGVLVAAELVTGTFYLLMLALGAAAGALAAHAGLGLNAQILLAALAGGGSVVGWHLHRRSRPQSTGSDDALQHLDIGRTVKVSHWRADGTARVSHRGADWDARYVGTAPAATGLHVIRAIESSTLLLDRTG